MKRMMNGLIMALIAGFLFAPLKMFGLVDRAKLIVGPTVENALAADQQFAMALQNNDSLGIVRMLNKDWAVITSHGDIAEGPDVFPSGIRSGQRMLNAQEATEPRVRLYGNIALVTSKVRLAGQLGGKTYDDIKMRQTDVLRWEHGGWKCVLTQEALVKE